jgi:hypothetical protein
VVGGFEVRKVKGIIVKEKHTLQEILEYIAQENDWKVINKTDHVVVVIDDAPVGVLVSALLASMSEGLLDPGDHDEVIDATKNMWVDSKVKNSQKVHFPDIEYV